MKNFFDQIKPIMALIIVTFSFVYFFSIGFNIVKKDSEVLIAVVGTLGIVTGYYFGNSLKD